MGFPDYIRKKAFDLKTHLQKSVQTLLEKKELPPAKEDIFEVEVNLSGIEDLRFGLPLTYPKRVDSLFSKLSPYFDGGVLFNKNAATWSPIRSFFKGRAVPLTSVEKKLQFEFPVLTLTEIKKASHQKVLQDLGIDLQTLNTDAFLMHPHPDYMILVLSSMTDPWRKLHIEKLQTQILMAVSDVT